MQSPRPCPGSCHSLCLWEPPRHFWSRWAHHMRGQCEALGHSSPDPTACSVLALYPQRWCASLWGSGKGSPALLREGSGWPCPARACVHPPISPTSWPFPRAAVQVVPGPPAPQAVVHTGDKWGGRGPKRASPYSVRLLVGQPQLVRAPQLQISSGLRQCFCLLTQWRYTGN